MKSGYILKHAFGSTIFFLVIFVSAGRFNYWQGLVYVAIGLLMSVLSYTVLSPDPELLAERGKPGEGSKRWDKAILLFSFVTTLAMYAIAGLDSGRYHWSPGFNPGQTKSQLPARNTYKCIPPSCWIRLIQPYTRIRTMNAAFIRSTGFSEKPPAPLCVMPYFGYI